MPEDSAPGKQVRDWRHRLQKEFLHPNSIIPENMPAMDELLRTVEEYGDKMTAADLIASKIGKVLRHISLLAPAKIPREEEYRFIARAAALMEVYTSIMLIKRDEDVAQDNEEQKSGSGDTDERKLRRQSGLTEATDDFTLVDSHPVNQT
ncbi:PWWP domain-containing protein [Mycena kentingensis (nom. inval.)]|nr:PWWP domain-containing protein [Mycena kentingensis (nom. inval.)]